MYHDFWGPKGLQGTHMDTLKPKNSKSITFTEKGGFFTFWAILAHSAPWPISQKMSKFPPTHIHQKISIDVGNMAFLSEVILEDGKVQIL